MGVGDGLYMNDMLS